MSGLIRSACQPCQRDLLPRLFHTTSPTFKIKYAGRRKSFKLKTATELKLTREDKTPIKPKPPPQPKSPPQPRSRPPPPPNQPPFAHEEPPHSGADRRTPEERMSFRRKTTKENELDWRRRRSIWGEEIMNGHQGRVLHASSSRNKKYPQSSSRANAHADQKRPPAQLADSSKESTVKMSTDISSPSFTSPPLIPGILHCLLDVLGPKATPTKIQALSLQYILSLDPSPSPSQTETQPQWRQFLLASETGSGKSIAYLLPVLQALKQSENSPSTRLSSDSSQSRPQRKENPRALILAPTHELSRQLSAFAKDLLHEAKLKVVCASQANIRTRGSDRSQRGSASEMKKAFDSDFPESGALELDIKMPAPRQADVFVGTPMKILEMVKGRGWDRKENDGSEEEDLVNEDGEKRRWRRGRDKVVDFGPGRWKAEPEMDLSNVEWVVVDEADVLFDPDFQETTRFLLSEISNARGHPVSLTPEPSLSSFHATEVSDSTVNAISYPFNLILTSATIPNSLSNYLERHHPSMQRLISPKIHRLPSTLQTEYVDWSGGNKHADIEKRIRQVWAEDSVSSATGGAPKLSKVLIFCNKGKRVESLGEYLEEKGIKNVWLTGKGDNRAKGSNRHLDGFLKKKPVRSATDGSEPPVADEVEVAESSDPSDPKQTPHVMITTSLLSRGLDFSSDVKNVFIVDEPRNLIDFLHRAGRSARAGGRGRVVVFGKYEGRGSDRAKEVRRRVAELGK